MSSDWPLVKFGEIVEITSSKRVKRADYVAEGVPFFRSKEVIERSKGNDISTELFITEEHFQNIYNKFGAPKVGDILLTSVGTLGVPYQVQTGDRFYFKDGNLTWFRNFKDTVDSKFLYYWLTSPIAKRKFDEVTIGSTQKALTIVALKSLELYLPPIEIQNQIVEILDSLDGKLTNNRQTNQTLEQIAQALFKSWFVYFDPVKAKIAAKQAGGNAQQIERAAMAAISGKTETELDQLFPDQYEDLKSTAALFPNAMQDSELAEIPVGWVALPLSETIKIIGGGTPKRSEPDYWNGDINWFSVKDAPSDGSVFVIDTKEKVTRLGVAKSSTKILSVGTTIISARGTVGKLALVGVETAMNQSCYGINGKNSIGSYLNYLNMKHMVAELQRNTHGAVFDTITTKTFETVQITKASEALNQNFERIIRPLFDQILNNQHETKSLTEIRDNLLPKLLSRNI